MPEPKANNTSEGDPRGPELLWNDEIQNEETSSDLMTEYSQYKNQS